MVASMADQKAATTADLLVVLKDAHWVVRLVAGRVASMAD